MVHIPCVEIAKNSKTATEYRRKLCSSILNIDPISNSRPTVPRALSLSFTFCFPSWSAYSVWVGIIQVLQTALPAVPDKYVYVFLNRCYCCCSSIKSDTSSLVSCINNGTSSHTAHSTFSLFSRSTNAKDEEEALNALAHTCGRTVEYPIPGYSGCVTFGKSAQTATVGNEKHALVTRINHQGRGNMQ